MAEAARGMAALSLAEVYPMDQPRLGRALIINNNKFKNPEDNRKGSEIDAANLQSLLMEMGFMVELESDLTREELEMAIESFQRMANHKDSNAAFLCMMTHGCDAGLICVDGKVKPWDEFTTCLDTVYTLIDKPKIILVQACRGGSHDGGQVRSDSSRVHLPTGADVFLMFPTVKGTVSWRYEETGSFLVKNLVPVFKENYRNMDIQKMYNIVKRRVAQEGTKGKQAAEAVDRLRYDFYFTSKPAQQLAVQEREALMKEVTRVRRGPNWTDGDEDGGIGSLGTVTQDSCDYVKVKWDAGGEGRYVMGLYNHYEVEYV